MMYELHHNKAIIKKADFQIEKRKPSKILCFLENEIQISKPYFWKLGFKSQFCCLLAL